MTLQQQLFTPRGKNSEDNVWSTRNPDFDSLNGGGERTTGVAGRRSRGVIYAAERRLVYGQQCNPSA